MKYMGSKRWQLENGLGHQLRRVAQPGDTFVDLFSGSGAVSWFAAEQLGLRVSAFDLQQYAVTTTSAVIGRTRAVDARRLVKSWIDPVRDTLAHDPETQFSRKQLAAAPLDEASVIRMRRRAAKSSHVFTTSYGGHYFSIEQARVIDELRRTLPNREPHTTLCLAALIMAASRCSASPGHTAQPFQPTARALPHIDGIWRRDLLDTTQATLLMLAARHASIAGDARRADASDVAKRLRGGELVFVDPPYSAAQYSRFYHVLEAIAIGGYANVNGAGRSPAAIDRASSSFSRVSTARGALLDLLEDLARAQCRVVATFPQYLASNGLSGAEIAELARVWFAVDVHATSSRFSTLGGNGSARAARRRSQELVITMFPRTEVRTGPHAQPVGPRVRHR